MKKTTFAFLTIIGILSILAGAYQAFTGVDFNESFFGIFIGAALIGAAYFSRKNPTKTPH